MPMSGHVLYNFDTISKLMFYLGVQCQDNPLIAMMKYSPENVYRWNPGDQITLNFFKISFKTSFSGTVRYGQKSYGFKDGGLAFIAPHQALTVSADSNVYEGYSLYFHADLLRNYPLEGTIKNYNFFHYSTSEALSLSGKEKKVVASLFHAISEELLTDSDLFSQDILISQLEQLLNYSNRFYHRQFITRKKVHHSLINKLDNALEKYLHDNMPLTQGLPTVQYFADQLNITAHYLSDILRTLSGISTQQYIQSKLIETAKERLLSRNATVADVAYELGFAYPQSFSKMFKKHTGQSPLQYKKMINY